MTNNTRMFGLLLYKNFIIRIRNWKTTLFQECLITIALFALIQAVRDFTVQPPRVFNESTYYEIYTKEHLTFINRDYTFLYYVPQNSYTKDIIESTRMCLKLQYENVAGFLSEDDMINDYTKLQVEVQNSEVFAVVFERYNTTDIKYKIRHNFNIPHTLFSNSFNAPELYFYYVPFLQLQMCLDESFINHTPQSPMERKLSIQKMPDPPYIKVNDFDMELRMVMCTFAVVIFIMPLNTETRYATNEKCIGVNVLMAINGVKQYQNLLSWLITSILFSNFYTIPIIVLLMNTFSENVDPYLHYSNAFIVWLMLPMHVAHLTTFGIHVTAYFSKPRFGLTILTIVYFVIFQLNESMIKAEIFSIIPFIGLLFPNVLLYRFLAEVNTYETQLTGVQWSNMFVPGDIQYNVTGSAGFVLILSLLGILLHFFLALYISAVFPGKYGVRKKPFYFLKYLRRNKVHLDDDIEDFDYDTVDNENFESVTKGALTPGIQIRNLKKTYTTGYLRRSKVHALKGVSMDLYKAQITALLGHNGAGKTTLMSILTGVISPSEGKVLINGKSLAKDLESIRNDLGLCPQENIVFPDMTVFEQLEFFGLLKGVNKTRKEVRRNVDILLNKLKLREKRNALPATLSGGQKRRLCLGMVLIGDASTIILDEPTSGMDPETRRDIWDIILKNRETKTILISTHSMEEADILGDRIAILHGGQLKCYSTSMFLKKQYGLGHLEVTFSTTTSCNSSEIINKFDSGTQQISVDSEKIVLSVPNNDTLPQTLDKIESQKKKLGVTGISVSLITLEEVFLKVIKKEEKEKHLNEIFCSPFQKVEGWPLCIQTILALYSKKLTYTKKNLTHLLMLLLATLAIVLVGLGYVPTHGSTEIFPLELDMYRYPKVVYSSDNSTIGTHYKNSVEYFGGTAEEAGQGVSVSQALLDHAVRDLAEYRNNYIVSAEFNISNGIVHANGLYSGTAMHSVPLTMNLLSNALIKSVAGEKYSIHVSSQRLPDTLSETVVFADVESMSRALVFCAIFFPALALFLNHPFQEMESKMKQLQRMTGVTSFSYWGTMLTFDFLVLTFFILLMMLGFYIMDVMLEIRMYYRTEILIMTLLLLLFGINSLLVTYIFTFINKSRNTVSVILSTVPTGVVFIQILLHKLIESYSKLKVLHVIQKKIFRMIPHVSLLHGQVSFLNVAITNARCRRLPKQLQDVTCLNAADICCSLDCADGVCKEQLPYFSDYSSDLSLGECIVYLSVMPLIYFAVLIILEERLIYKLYAKVFDQRLKNGGDIKDEEVAKEKQAVQSELRKLMNRDALSQEGNKLNYEGKGMPVSTVKPDVLESPENGNESLFLVYELSKYYGKLMAVREINFRVKQRECFGLLGVNGAGKSTTFRMLTGEEMPNSGIMYLGRSEIRTDRRNYLAQMGYCPQTDALLRSLNSFDHLRLFALLRGIPKSKVELEVNKWINRLNLNACMNQASGTYSGGNKRRLNIAMALIGNPTLVLLDEPTTGVDPAARRSLWNVVQSCQAMGQAIILTSHSMEECEALCNRLVIMVKGQLVCVGASQELKQRFGAGYDIHIKLNPNRSEDDLSNIKSVMESSLTCEIRDENLGLLAYHVTDCGTTWQKMYGTMKDLKDRYSCIDDYAVLSATLEQLFIQFARGTESKTENVSDSNTEAAFV